MTFAIQCSGKFRHHIQLIAVHVVGNRLSGPCQAVISGNLRIRLNALPEDFPTTLITQTTIRGDDFHGVVGKTLFPGGAEQRSSSHMRQQKVRFGVIVSDPSARSNDLTGGNGAEPMAHEIHKMRAVVQHPLGVPDHSLEGPRDPTIFDSRPNLPHSGIGTTNEIHKKLNASAFACLSHGIAFSDGQGQGFFAKDGPGAHSGQHRIQGARVNYSRTGQHNHVRPKRSRQSFQTIVRRQAGISGELLTKIRIWIHRSRQVERGVTAKSSHMAQDMGIFRQVAIIPHTDLAKPHHNG